MYHYVVFSTHPTAPAKVCVRITQLSSIPPRERPNPSRVDARMTVVEPYKSYTLRCRNACACVATRPVADSVGDTCFGVEPFL